jgi:HlyD family secretion protein
VTVKLSSLPAITVIPTAAIRRNGSQPIVWRIVDTSLKTTSITLGISDLDGYVQVIDGLAEGDEIVVYSNAELKADSPIRVVTDIAGAGQ